MLASQVPSKFSVPFAVDAGASYIRAIPLTQPTPGNGQAALDPGFPPETFTPPGGGGFAPDGRDFNGLLFQTTGWARWFAAGGPIRYDATFQGSIGGYPQGAVVASAVSLGLFWLSIVDDNTTNPDTGGTGWVNAYPTVSRVSIANDVGAPNTKVDASYYDGASTQSLVIDLTTGNSTSTANGMDGETRPTSGPVYIYSITGTNGTVAGLGSTSNTSPTLPSGYGNPKYLGGMLTDASANLYRTRQTKDDVQYTITTGSNTAGLRQAAAGASQGSTTTPTWVAISLAGFVPPTAARVRGSLIQFVGNLGAMIAPNNNYGPVATLTNPPPVVTVGTGSIEDHRPFDFLIESTSFATALYWASSAGGNAGVFIQGWKDKYAPAG